jgi:hypothetical protein
MSYGAGIVTGVVCSFAVFLIFDKPLSMLGERLRDWIFRKRP